LPLLKSIARRLHGPGRPPAASARVFLCLGAAASVLSVPIVIVVGGRAAMMLDTGQQIVASFAAAAAAFLATRAAPDKVKFVGRGIALTLCFPGPGLFLWWLEDGGWLPRGMGAGVFAIGVLVLTATMARAIFAGMPRARVLRVALDTAMLLAATLTVLLVLWHRTFDSDTLNASNAANIVVATAMLSIPAAAFLALLDRAAPLRLRGPYSVLAGMGMAGVAMSGWLLSTAPAAVSLFDATVQPTDYAISAGVLLCAYGAMTWDPVARPASGSGRFMQAAVDMFPLFAVGVCVGLLLLWPIDAADLQIVKAGTAAAVVLALTRQMLLTTTERRASRAERNASARLQAELRGRESVLRSLSHVEIAATPEATAKYICREALTIDGVDSAAVVAFLSEDQAVLLGGSHVEDIAVGHRRGFPPQRAKELHARAALGAWCESERPETAATQQRSIFGPDIRGVTHAPLVWNEAIVGVVSLATARETLPDVLAERLATAREFGLVAGPVLGPALENRRRLEIVREGVSRIIESGAFHPVFQPILDLSSGRTVGFEALTRFDGGRRPDHWFADAEAVGLGIELETATLRAALFDAEGLTRGAYLSINASPNLAGALIPLLAALESVDRDIVVEITEQAPVASYLRLREALSSLRGHVRIAVDDAGAGYAGLQHILEIGPDIVKLDISLVRGVNSDPARRALIASMVSFAAETRCTLLAEGIETDEERATLRALGVELGQGYLLGRPATLEQIGLERAAARAATRVRRKPAA